jgi:hypothetical protein
MSRNLIVVLGLCLACTAGPSDVTPTSQPESDTTPTTAPPAPDLSAFGCAGRFGVDPNALKSACGLGPLISHDDLGYVCELRYADTDSQENVVFMLREHRNRDPEQAWALHQAGFPTGIEIGSFADIDGSHWHRQENYRWVYLPGWKTARRIGWSEPDCAPERMLPVLRAVVIAPEPKRILPPRWQPDGSSKPAESLSSLYGARTDLGLDALGERELPTLAKRLVIALISAAARDDLDTIRGLLGPGASFGLPDRREYEAWPLDNDANLEVFAANLNLVATRFDAEAGFSCPPVQPEHTDDVTRGARPMWCSYVSADGLDVLAFRLHTIDGRGQVEYVGMFETRPTEPLVLPPTEPSPPPITPDSAAR